MTAAPITIAAWERNDREVIRVRLDQFNGRDVLDCRVWWRDREGEYRPGRSGLTVSVRHLPQLAAALDKALAEAKARGLLGEGAAA